jgi:hypothetical protein
MKVVVDETRPEQKVVNQVQVKRLNSLTGLDVKELSGKSIAQLAEKFKWHVDPSLFFFRKICGKVVKKDPTTGVEYPVPFATVYVEDTDCNLVSYFPKPWPWGWFFPIFCHREILGSTKTDACGNFCVLVPRFDIDWILRWRLKHVCYPIIFKRPTLGDLIPRLPQEVVGPWPPIPGPDPGPLDILTSLPASTIEAVAGHTAGKLALQAVRLKGMQSLNTSNQPAMDILNKRVFESELPPPLPAEFQQALAGQGIVAAKGASAVEGIRSAVAVKLGLDPAAKEISGFNPQHFIGPFIRCFNYIVPEWQIILDVPDITFRVKQDINGDGNEETIYSEGFFDIRWNADPIPDVTLVASSNAKETHTCQIPAVPCGTVPAILFAGFMPLTIPSYFDAANGWALRPNRPTKDGLDPSHTAFPRDPAQTPFCWTIQFYGCVDVSGAKYYRILSSMDNGATFGVITGLAWNNYLNTGGTPIPIACDSAGWYAVNPINPVTSNPVPRSSLEFPNLILDWPTPTLGKSTLKIELADANRASLGIFSANVAIESDNSAPIVTYTQLAWKFAGESDAMFRNLLGIPCPTIHRKKVPQDIVVVFQVSVSAKHLRNAYIWPYGCGGGSFSYQSGTTSHWHTSAANNSVILDGRYLLSASALEGSYGFYAWADSCAMNPSGADGGNLLPTDWYYDPIYIYTNPYIGVAIINAD